MKAWALVLLLGCTPTVEPPPLEAIAPRGELGPLDALARRFGRVRRRMSARGYGSAVALERTFVLDDAGEAFPIDLPRGRCTTALALAGGDVQALHLRLYDRDGVLVAIDSVDGAAGLVHHCPELSSTSNFARVYLTVESERGSGGVVAAAYESVAGEGEGFERLFEDVVPPVVPLGPVEEAFATSRAGRIERGLSPQNGPTFLRLAEGQVTRARVEFRVDTCLLVTARGDRGIQDLDLYLYGPDGAEVARDLGVEGEPQLEYCPSVAGTGTLELRVFEGAGAAGWMVWSAPLPPEAEDAPIEAPVQELEPLAIVTEEADALHERGFSSPRVLRQDGQVSPGETLSIDAPLGAGCAWILAAAGPGEVDLDLYLRDGDQSALDRDVRVRRTARVGACLDSPRHVQLMVKAYGQGHFALVIVDAPPSITDVATLRAEGATAALVARGFEQERVETHPHASVERQVRIPAGECVGLVVAGDADLEDIDLIAVDSEGERVASDTGRAPWASIAPCAGDEDLELTIELVPYRGDGAVVLHWLRRTSEEVP
ncbi:MAG: hypothetical protein ACI9KE_005656 [Polyangiales bacterium]